MACKFCTNKYCGHGKSVDLCMWDWDTRKELDGQVYRHHNRNVLRCVAHKKKNHVIIRSSNGDPVLDTLMWLYVHQQLTGLALIDAGKLAQETTQVNEK